LLATTAVLGDQAPTVAVPTNHPAPAHRAFAAAARVTASPAAHAPAPLSPAALASAKRQVASALRPTVTSSVLATPLVLGPDNLTAQVGWTRGEILFFDAGLLERGTYMARNAGGTITPEFSFLVPGAAYLLDCSFAGPPTTVLHVVADYLQANATLPTYEGTADIPIGDGHVLYGIPGLAGIAKTDVYFFIPAMTDPNTFVSFHGCTLSSAS
jgi:hypothetical protein